MNKKAKPAGKKNDSRISKNGNVLRAVADWLSELATKDGKSFSAAKARHADKVNRDQSEAGEKIGYAMGQAARTSGFILLKLLELVSRTTNVLVVDNAILRKLEQKYKELNQDDKKFKAWLKKHPAISSYLTTWLTMVMLLLGRYGYNKFKEPSTKDNKPETEIVQSPEKGQYAKDVKTYDVSDDNFVRQFFDDNWNNFVIFLSEFETFRSTPVKQSGESRYTYGPGLTWVWEKTANGKYVRHSCVGKWKTKAEKFTKQQMWEQAQIHLLHETLPTIQEELKAQGFKNVPANQLFALVVSGYQLPGHISGIVSKLQQAGNNAQKCADAFAHWGGSHSSKFYKGTMKRRWWCANIYLGYIDCHDLLDMNRDVFSAVDFNVIKPNDGSFAMDASTLAYAMLKTNDKTTVREFIAQHKLLTNPDDCYTKSQSVMLATADPSVVQMAAGLKAFKQKDYEKAMMYYNKAIELNPGNIAAYSDLTLVYKTYADKLYKNNPEDKATAIDYYKKCCEQLDKINQHLKSNKKILVDDASMAYVYYNVATAQDALANIYKSQGDKSSAKSYYKSAMENYGEAEKHGTDAEIDDKYIKIYQNKKAAAEENYKTLKKSKTVAFNQGKNNLKTRAILERQSQIIGQDDNEYA